MTSGHSVCLCRSFSNDWDVKDCIHTLISDRTALIVCVCSWRRVPCRFERLPIMRKQVTSLKDHTYSSTLSFSHSHTHMHTLQPFKWCFQYLPFSESTLYQIQKSNLLIELLCIYFKMLLTVYRQLHEQSQPKAQNMSNRNYFKVTHRSTCRWCLWTYYPWYMEWEIRSSR